MWFQEEKISFQLGSANLDFSFIIIRQAQIFGCACLKHKWDTLIIHSCSFPLSYGNLMGFWRITATHSVFSSQIEPGIFMPNSLLYTFLHTW